MTLLLDERREPRQKAKRDDRVCGEPGQPLAARARPPPDQRVHIQCCEQGDPQILRVQRRETSQGVQPVVAARVGVHRQQSKGGHLCVHAHFLRVVDGERRGSQQQRCQRAGQTAEQTSADQPHEDDGGHAPHD